MRYPCTLFFSGLFLVWYVLLGYYALGYGSYACLLVPLLYCRFRGAVFDVVLSRQLHFTCVFVVAATLQPVVAARCKSLPCP